MEKLWKPKSEIRQKVFVIAYCYEAGDTIHHILFSNLEQAKQQFKEMAESGKFFSLSLYRELAHIEMV